MTDTMTWGMAAVLWVGQWLAYYWMAKVACDIAYDVVSTVMGWETEEPADY